MPALTDNGLKTPLRAHQQPVKDDCVTQFSLGARRLTAVMATGTGKTLTALHTVQEVAPQGSALVVVPTLELLEQTAAVWYAQGRSGTYIALCSRNPPETPGVAGFLTMTDDLRHLTEHVLRASGPVNVFTTYRSVSKIPAAHRDFHLPQWDILVADEAHRSTGPLTNASTIIHDDRALPVRHRLYMTATPRKYEPQRPNDPRCAPSVEVASMDDVATFGDVVCRISLAESIDQGLLADFRLVAVEVSDAELRSILNRHSVTEPHTDGLRVAAAQVALLKAQYKYDMRRTLTFHSRIAGATIFAETLHETATVMPPALQGPLQTATINSSQSRLERRQAKDQFATVPLSHGSQRLPRAVLTSCRCFAEGVDLPAIDSILFCDPKTSSLDIVQAIGRALRQNPGDGKIATIVVPVYIKPGQDIGEGLKGTAFHFIHEVMIALSTYDEHIFVRLEYYRSLEEEPEVLHPCARPERADEIMPLLALASADSPHAVWELGLDSARRYLETHNNLNVRSRYCGPDRFYLGWWIGKQRSLRKNGLLLQERIDALDALGMIWEHPPHSIEYRLQIARDYAARHGHLVPRENETHGGIHLGRWLAQRRSEARQRTLPFCYQRALNEIYPWWTASKWGSTWHHTYAQARLAACRGELPFPDQRPDSDDPPLAGWLDEQIDNLLNLHPDQHDLLGALQLDHPLALLLRRPRSSTGWAFLRGLHAALTFWRSHQHLDVPAGYIGHRGAYIGLARWLDGCRRAPQKLTEHQRHALEALDMRWI